MKKKFKYYLHFNDKPKIIGDTMLSFRDIKTMYKSTFEKSMHILLGKRVSDEELKDMTWFFVYSDEGYVHGFVIDYKSRGTEKYFTHDDCKKAFKDIKEKYFS